ncbi:MAG: hypothetical protein JKY42_10525 [Flavobacteriales bacterium]|nr:hypothetical protein [Flavobacteriales bacterium]
MKKFIKITGYFFLFLVLIGFVTLSVYQPVSLAEDTTFRQNIKTISTADFEKNKDKNPTLAGWARANITPKEKVNTTRTLFKEPFESVADSLYVNCIYLKNGKTEVVILSYDLLLITPELANSVKTKLKSQGISAIYFSASHTHSSFGGFGRGIVSEIALGEFNQNILDHLLDKSVMAVKQARENNDTLLNIVFSEKKINRCINRVTKEEYIDEGLRQVYFTTSSSTAILSSLNIHPTFVWSKRKILTKDYPRIFSRENGSEFAMFVAGTMGSIKPMNYKVDTMQITKFKEVVDATDYSIYDDSIKNINAINFHSIKLETPTLKPLLTEYIGASGFLSNFLLGSTEISIEVLRIGEVLMIALPCELSAEFYPNLQQLAEKKGLRLVVTSFNGSYVGYATPSQNFSIDHMETRTMNWTGKYGGDYFNELVKAIIEKQP